MECQCHKKLTTVEGVVIGKRPKMQINRNYTQKHMKTLESIWTIPPTPALEPSAAVKPEQELKGGIHE